jgi:hypothetical protein
MSQPIDPEETQIADAAQLLKSERNERIADAAPAPDVELGTYDVEGSATRKEPVEASRTAARAEPPAVLPRIKPPRAAVSRVWTRGAEWNADLARLAALAGAAVIVIYGLTSVGHWIPAFLMLMVSLGLAACLAYPLVITLERPVRMTPDRAVRDYYAALSHSFPHYRRMWLLLSDKGHSTGGVTSEADLRAYWKARRHALSRNGRPWLPALLFDVMDYKGQKAGGKAEVEAEVTIEVRESSTDGSLKPAIGRFQFPLTLARGPDNQWYLDSGLIPQASAETSDSSKSPDPGDSAKSSAGE